MASTEIWRELDSWTQFARYSNQIQASTSVEMSETLQISLKPKIQLISKRPFGVFKSSKKTMIIFKNFCLAPKRGQIKKAPNWMILPLFIFWFNLFLEAAQGQKSIIKFHFSVALKTTKGNFENNWPLVWKELKNHHNFSQTQHFLLKIQLRVAINVFSNRYFPCMQFHGVFCPFL